MSQHHYSGSVAEAYDQYLSPLLFEPYATEMVSRLYKVPMYQVLELACGTGCVTKKLLPVLETEAKLVATDISPDMLQRAQLFIKDPRIQFKFADAMTLPFAPESFDTVFCQFGVMFFPDKTKSYREVLRVLQPGGRYVFSVWDDYGSNPRSAVVHKVVKEVFGSDAPDLLKKGPYSYHDRHLINKDLGMAGFKVLNIDVVQKVTRFMNISDVVRGFVDGSPLHSFLQRKPAKKVEELREKLAGALLAQTPLYGQALPTQALFIEAEKGR
jgi:SAM-dependent methyltransferase